MSFYKYSSNVERSNEKAYEQIDRLEEQSERIRDVEPPKVEDKYYYNQTLLGDNIRMAEGDPVGEQLKKEEQKEISQKAQSSQSSQSQGIEDGNTGFFAKISYRLGSVFRKAKEIIMPDLGADEKEN